jgi:TolB protein
LYGIAVLAATTPAAAQRRPLTLATQLTYSQNYDPAISPDGRRIIYISMTSGREQLFVMNIDGSHASQITHDDVDHEDPVWSPDGSKIAFVFVRDSLEIISLINPDGSGLEYISPRGMRAIHPSFTPDGSKLTFCTDDDLHPPRKNDADIYTIDLRTRQVQRLIAGGVNTFPVWSPDGNHLAFRRMIGEMNSEVFVADADGSNQRNLTNHPAFDGWPAWSPDGKRIAFASNRNANYQIFVMSADGTDVQLVANTEGRATAPKWSPDGGALYFPICRKADFGSLCEIFVAHPNRRF